MSTNPALAKTYEKSMVLGVTKKPEPKEVRWLQAQTVTEELAALTCWEEGGLCVCLLGKREIVIRGRVI